MPPLPPPECYDIHTYKMFHPVLEARCLGRFAAVNICRPDGSIVRKLASTWRLDGETFLFLHWPNIWRARELFSTAPALSWQSITRQGKYQLKKCSRGECRCEVAPELSNQYYLNFQEKKKNPWLISIKLPVFQRGPLTYSEEVKFILLRFFLRMKKFYDLR